jgi:hypothetical protein
VALTLQLASTIGGENNDPSPIMAARVIMVELTTRSKALPGDSPSYYLFTYLFSFQ